MNKKSEIVYVGHVCLEKFDDEDSVYTDAIISGLVNKSKENIIASVKMPSSYKFTLVLERMEFPASIYDWNNSQRVIIDEER